eukprot:1256395-Heterocapsa_arctica.AAC.1
MDMTRSCPDVLTRAKQLGWSGGAFARLNMAVRLEDHVLTLLASTEVKLGREQWTYPASPT